MKKLIIILLLLPLVSCASNKVIQSRDITNESKWLESDADNPIINVIQKYYANNDIEIIIKKKLTTDYVNIRLSRKGRTISKTTTRNESAEEKI